MAYRIGIAGDESRYWLNLMEYLNSQTRIQVFLCTKDECLIEEVMSKEAEVLFLREDYEGEMEFGIPCIRFSMDRENRDTVYQLQPAHKIYEQMCHFIEKKMDSGNQGKAFAVYSPLGRSGKTSFACAYGRAHSFFYIGMEEYGIKGNNNKNTGEILYHIRNRKEGIANYLCSFSEDWYGLSLIASPVYYQDIRLMESEDFRWFLEQIRQDGRGLSVMMDFGSGCLPDFEILDCFDKVYVPILDGEEEQRKLDCFFELLYEVNGRMQGKIQRIKVPDIPWWKEEFLENVRYLDEAIVLKKGDHNDGGTKNWSDMSGSKKETGLIHRAF